MPKTSNPRQRILDALKEVRGHVPRGVLNKSMLGRQTLTGWFLITPTVTLFLGPNKVEAVRQLMDITPDMWATLDGPGQGAEVEEVKP